GSGKTTLIKTILNKINITSGSIEYEGENIFSSLKDFRQRIAYVPQNSFNSLDIFTTVNIQFHKLLKSLGKSFDTAYINNLIEKFMLPANVLERKPVELSDGMKHRIIIIMALATDKDVLIFDEPTTGMDPISAYNVLSAIKEVKGKKDIIITGNDAGSIFGICDMIYIMYRGQIIENGSYSDIMNSCFHPYTEMLLEYIPSYSNRNKNIELYENRNINHDGCVFLDHCRHAGDKCHKSIEYNYIDGHGYRCIRYPEWKND
ncbi:MAG: ATP-binding cassette domain-containing protein, partial [Ferroplasma sp.]